MTGLILFLIGLGFLAGAGIDWAADRYSGSTHALRDSLMRPQSVLTAVAGALIAVAAVVFGPGGALLWLTALLGWALLALAVIDLRTYLLPDKLNLAVFILGAVMVAFYRQDIWLWHLAGAVAGYGLLWLVETGYRHLRGMEGLGRGDAKLLGAIGIWVGLQGIPPVLLIASLSGILAAISLSVLKRQSVSGNSMIAFGPWIALAGYIVWLLPPVI